MVFHFSSTAFRLSSMAFLFPRNPRKSIYGGKYTKDHHSSFVFPATRSPSFAIATCSPSFVIATCSPSFVIAPHSPSFAIATMHASHPTGGAIPLFRVAIRATKNCKKKITRGLRCPPYNIYTQQPTKNMRARQRRNRRGD
jgi:hypothetical protein